MGISVFKKQIRKLCSPVYTLTLILVISGCGFNNDDSKNANKVDTRAPDISLIGPDHVFVESLEDYIEYGASAHDPEDGFVRVSIQGNIIELQGVNEITYTAFDSAGNVSTTIRRVTIGDRLCCDSDDSSSDDTSSDDTSSDDTSSDDSGSDDSDSGSGGNENTVTNQTPIVEIPSMLAITEGNTEVVQIVAYDPENDPISFELVGGADKHLFTISATGTINFIQVPDFELPTDANSDNHYEISVQGSDGNSISDVEITTIEVVNAVEGRAIDGPLSGSLVFIDLNGNTINDDDEPSAISDSDGYFSISTVDLVGVSGAKLVVLGGIDTSINVEMVDLVLMSDMPTDMMRSVSVTPISSIIASADTPEQKVAILTAFNINESLDDFLELDIWDLAVQGDIEAQRMQNINQQVAVLISSVKSISAIESDVTGLTVNLFEALANEAEDQERVDFTSQAMLADIIQEVIPAVEDDVLTATTSSLLTVNLLIESEADITSSSALDLVGTVQTDFQDLLSDIVNNDTQTTELDLSFQDDDNDGVLNLFDADDDVDLGSDDSDSDDSDSDDSDSDDSGSDDSSSDDSSSGDSSSDDSSSDDSGSGDSGSDDSGFDDSSSDDSSSDDSSSDDSSSDDSSSDDSGSGDSGSDDSGSDDSGSDDSSSDDSSSDDSGSGDSSSDDSGSDDSGSDDSGSMDDTTPETLVTPLNIIATSSSAGMEFVGLSCELSINTDDNCAVLDNLTNTQAAYISSSTMSGDQKVVTISYVSDDSTTTGLGLRIHFDSTAMSLTSVSDDVLANDRIAAPSVDNVISDVDDLDGDSETDSYVLASWASLFGQWPNALTADLFTLTFNM
ncbi:MAG: immunoglobulin-like domain-containing protein [Porticoccaceae bacterium]